MEEELINVEIGVLRIKTLSFNMFENIEPVQGEVLLGYGLNLFWNVEEDWYDIIISYNFTRSSDNASLLNGATLTRFLIKDIKKYAIEDGKLILPDSALITIFGIAFAHMRALVAQNTAGTIFSWLMIPIVNPTELLHNLLKTMIEQVENDNLNLEKQ